MAMLYEVCPACNDAGVLRNVRTNTDPVPRDRPCPGCKPLRVVPTGATAAQLEAAVERAQNYEDALRRVQAACGLPDAADAVRTVLAIAGEVLQKRGRK